MGRLHIDDRVEGVGFKRQIFGVAFDKNQSVNLMPLLAKPDAGGIQVEGH